MAPEPTGSILCFAGSISPSHLAWMSSPRDKRIADCQSVAMQAGLIGAFKGLAVSAPALAAALYLSPGFARATGPSSRTALVMSPFFLMFWLRSEQSLTACARRSLDVNSAMSAK